MAPRSRDELSPELRLLSPNDRGSGECRVDQPHPRPHVQMKKAHELKSPQVGRNDPAFPARWLYDLFRALSGDRAFLSPSSLRSISLLQELHVSVEALRPRGFVVREPAHSSCAPSAAIASPRPTFVTIAKRPSWRARDGRISASDLPDEASQAPATRWHDGQISWRHTKCCRAQSSRVPDAARRVVPLRRAGTHTKTISRFKERWTPD
jgi:hypothetical protein